MWKVRGSVVGVLALVFLPTMAQAQTALVDRMGGADMFAGNLELAIGAWHNSDSITTMRTDLFLSGGTEMGGAYFQAALSSVFGDTTSVTQISNIEVGGYGNISMGPITFVGRLGIVLPLIEPDADGVFAGVVAFRARPNDQMLFMQDTFGIRPSFSAIAQFGIFKLRGDVGFDIGLSTADDRMGPERPTYIRLNLAIAAKLGLASLGLEFSNVGIVDDTEGLEFDSPASRFVHSMAFLVSLDMPMVQPYLAIVLPLDTVDETTFFTLGARFSM